MILPELSLAAWVALGAAAFTVGLSKSAFPAIGTIAVVLGAAVIPAKESTGLLLVMFLFGDIFSVWTYRRDADWRLLARLAPTIVTGVLLGVWFLAYANDRMTAITIGVILISLIAMTLYQRAKSDTPPSSSGRLSSAFYGILGGFTTMVANAGGPPMSLYFLALRLRMMTFLGTSAWLFALMNVLKLPFSIGLGLITLSSLSVNLTLLPLTAVGFAVGRQIIKRIDQQLFDRIILVATLIGAGYLIVTSI